MNSAIDITSEQRKTLVDLVRQYIPGVAVWAYGSRVKWTARPNSDLDLVAFTAPAQNQLVSELKNALAESELPFLVDLHVWDEIPERFREIIRGEYVVIQEQKAESRQLSLASDWRISTWGEEISLEYGKALRGYSSDKGEYRVYGSNGPIGWTVEPIAPGPGIILGRKGAYRGIKFSQEPFYVIDTAYYVVPKTEMDMRWLYYAMVYYKLGEIDDGSPIPSTTRSAVYIRELEIPTPREQRNIAGILGVLDDKIELNRKMNETLEAMARAIFKSWFVEFDPVRAKAEGREPEGMDADTAALFPSSFVDSGLGALPKGWTAVPLYGIAEFSNGAAYKEVHFSPRGEGLPVIKIAELKAGVAETTKFTAVDLGERYRIEQEEILFSWSGNPDTSIDTFIWSGGPAWLNQHIFRVRENGTAPRAWVYIQLKALRPVFAEIARDKQTTGLGHVTIADMKRLMVCKPTEEISLRFNQIASPIFDRIASNQRTSQILASVRDTLLPRLISGKLRVPEAEKLVEAVI